jgi:hypothetical protein
MATDTKKRRLFKRDQDLFDFGRAYLSEAFPNPDRQGCPTDEMLRRLAMRPTQSDASITDHLTCCSPCFNAYMAHLDDLRADAKQSRQAGRAIWIRRIVFFTGIAAVLVISSYLLFIKRQNTPGIVQRPLPAISKPGIAPQISATSKYISVLVDLSHAAPGRGTNDGAPRRSAQIVPASQFVDLTLHLPVGSEAAMYSITLSSKMGTEWSGSAKARLESGQPGLSMRADFSHIHPGQYDLLVVSKGLHLSVPVMVKSIPLNTQ